MDFTELEATLILQHIDGIGPSRFQKLIQTFGTAQTVLSLSEKELSTLAQTQYVKKLIETIKGLNSHPNHPLIQAAKREIDYCTHQDIKLLRLDGPQYPQQLREISAPPSLLYVKGDPNHLSELQLAVVGSRKASSDTLALTIQWAEHLANNGIMITSGLAEGIDGAAHRGALNAHQPTIAVVAHGLDHIYPYQHAELFEAISHRGAIVSEYAIGMKPQREFFPRRNRIISGLSRGVCVMEAASKSGSLVTAKYALEQNRDIFALPSHINNQRAQGCHSLIKQGAYLVTDYRDILESWSVEYVSSAQATTQEQRPQHISHPLLEYIPFSPTHFDSLMHSSKLPYAQLTQQLMELELSGHIIQDGGLYRRSR